jgi:hypothetical protein
MSARWAQDLDVRVPHQLIAAEADGEESGRCVLAGAVTEPLATRVGCRALEHRALSDLCGQEVVEVSREQDLSAADGLETEVLAHPPVQLLELSGGTLAEDVAVGEADLDSTEFEGDGHLVIGDDPVDVPADPVIDRLDGFETRCVIVVSIVGDLSATLAMLSVVTVDAGNGELLEQGGKAIDAVRDQFSSNLVLVTAVTIDEEGLTRVVAGTTLHDVSHADEGTVLEGTPESAKFLDPNNGLVDAFKDTLDGLVCADGTLGLANLPVRCEEDERVILGLVDRLLCLQRRLAVTDLGYQVIDVGLDDLRGLSSLYGELVVVEPLLVETHPLADVDGPGDLPRVRVEARGDQKVSIGCIRLRKTYDGLTDLVGVLAVRLPALRDGGVLDAGFGLA